MSERTMPSATAAIPTTTKKRRRSQSNSGGTEEQNQDNKKKKKQRSDGPKPTANKVSKQQKRLLDATSRAKTRKDAAMESTKKEERDNHRDKSRYTIEEHVRMTNKLQDNEKTLIEYCSHLYSTCLKYVDREALEQPEENTRNFTKCSTPLPQHETLGSRSMIEKHLKDALEHITEACELWEKQYNNPSHAIDATILLPPINTVTDMKSIKKLGTSVHKKLTTIAADFNVVAKACRNVDAAIKRTDSCLLEWERWKVHYVSDLRTLYDPTLGGGISKPTLDVLSIESSASKYRLASIRELNTEKTLVLKRWEEMINETKVPSEKGSNQSVPKPATLEQLLMENQLMDITSNGLELIRHEWEMRFADKKDRLNPELVKDVSGSSSNVPSVTTATTSQVLRGYHQNFLQNPSITKKNPFALPPLPTPLQPQSQPTTTKIFPTPTPKKAHMPDLSQYSRPQTQMATSDSDNDEPVILNDIFAANSAISIKAGKDRTLYNVGLYEAPWASKTTVRGAIGANSSNNNNNSGGGSFI